MPHPDEDLLKYCQVTLHRGLIQSVEDMAPTTVKAIQQDT